MATGSKLVIVESPTNAKNIGGYFGSRYTIKKSISNIHKLEQNKQ